MNKIKKAIFYLLLKWGKRLQKKNLTLDEKRKNVQGFAKILGWMLNSKSDSDLTEMLVGKIPVWYIPNAAGNNNVILFLHGGGHVFSFEHVGDFYRPFISLLAATTGAQIWAPDYRVAPENPLPAGLDDSFAVYNHLLDKGVKPDDIIIMGDSAGGGLTLSLLLRLKEKGIVLPKSSITFSAWTDLAATGNSITTKEDIDPMFTKKGLTEAIKELVSETTNTLPDRSPLYGDYTGMSPLMMFVGGREILFDDTIRVADKAKKQGVDVTLEVSEDMFHVYPIFSRIFPEGMDALKKIAVFIERK